MDNSVYWSVGTWFSIIYYDEEQTNTPTEGTKEMYKYSTSELGLRVNASAYVQPWDELHLEFYAGYNLGFFITPASTIKTTIGDQTTTTKGPDIPHFHDCGGVLGTRLFFDSQINY